MQRRRLTRKEVVEAATREKNIAVENAEERARAAEGARILVEQKVAEMVAKLEEVELRLAGVESINSARDKEIAELKAVLEESEDKWYNAGFTNTENLAELIMFQSWRYEFGEGWMAAVLAMGVPEDSPFRNPD